MAKEILLYQPIYSYSAASFIKELDDNKGNDVCVRMNCNGGNVMDAMGMIAKYNEHTGTKSVKVDGRAASMAAYFCAMTDDVECLDVSEFLIHRAAFPEWVENDKSVFTDDMKAMLARHNATLRGSLERKIDESKFKRMKGKSFDDIFSMDSRIDVTLTAKEAHSLGLVSRVIPLNKSKKREINALAGNVGIAAFYDDNAESETINEPQKPVKMTIAEVKADSAVYAQIKAEILAEEKDRVGAFAEYAAVDPAAVLAEIVAGNKFTQTFAAKMNVKAMSKDGIKNITDASAKPVATGEPNEETAEAKAEKAALAEMESVNKAVLARYGNVATA